jgi:hypothetical protein
MLAARLVQLTLAAVTRDFGAQNVVAEHIYPLIPTAIKALQDKLVVENPGKLENFRVEYTVAFNENGMDFTTATNAGLRLDLIKLAKIRVVYDTDPPQTDLVQMKDSLNLFLNPGRADDLYVTGFLEGRKVRIKKKKDEDDPADVTINGISCPSVVDDIAIELEGDLVMILATLASKLEIKERRHNVDVAKAKA